MKMGERSFPVADYPVRVIKIPGVAGVSVFRVPLVLDHGIIKMTYDTLGLDNAVSDPVRKACGLMGEDGFLHFGGFFDDARHYLLAADESNGNSEFKEAMQELKDFVEGNNPEEFNASDRRPAMGGYMFPCFELTGGGVLLFSPSFIPPCIKAELDAMGGVKAVVVATMAHTMFTSQVKELYPDCMMIGGQMLYDGDNPVTYNAVVDPSEWPSELAKVLDGFSVGITPLGIAGELTLLHKASGLLSFADVLYAETRSLELPMHAPGPEWDTYGKLFRGFAQDPSLDSSLAIYRYLMFDMMSEHVPREAGWQWIEGLKQQVASGEVKHVVSNHFTSEAGGDISPASCAAAAVETQWGWLKVALPHLLMELSHLLHVTPSLYWVVFLCLLTVPTWPLLRLTPAALHPHSFPHKTQESYDAAMAKVRGLYKSRDS
ncbi:unnamed protein product [Chrysoparadoxa australica]